MEHVVTVRALVEHPSSIPKKINTEKTEQTERIMIEKLSLAL